MNYTLKESRLESAIRNYFDELFDVSQIHWTHPYDYDEQTGEEGEDINRIEFYKGDYSEEDICFRWVACEYFLPDTPAKDICPEVVVEYNYSTILDGMFKELWHEPFRRWFIENFNLNVKTVATW